MMGRDGDGSEREKETRMFFVGLGHGMVWCGVVWSRVNGNGDEDPMWQRRIERMCGWENEVVIGHVRFVCVCVVVLLR